MRAGSIYVHYPCAVHDLDLNEPLAQRVDEDQAHATTFIERDTD
jgi:hypothetical protein